MHGLYLVWWVQHKQVSPAAVASVLAASDVFIMALELPTGWFADRFGRRVSLLAGSLVQVAGMIWCWLGNGVPGLIGACALIGIGDAFRSGADQALLYQSCAALGREHDFLKFEARTRTAELVALVLLVLLGGAIVDVWGWDAAWIAETALCAIGFAIAYAMVEPGATIQGSQGSRGSQGSQGSRGSRALGLIALVVPASVIAASGGALAFLAQTASGIDADQATRLVAGITLIEAAGAAVASTVAAGGVRRQLALAGLALPMLATAFIVPGAFYPVVFALSLLAGIAEALRAAVIQRVVADDVRARAASMASVCNLACLSVALPAAGIFLSAPAPLKRRRG